VPEPFDFSIIVPTLGRPAQLTACLRGIADLEYPRSRFEVIVVDDGSKEPAGPLVSAIAGQIHATAHRQPHAGPAAARNAGASLARGKYLAFTDDDCVPAPDWLTRLAARLEASPNRIAGGRTVNALPDNDYATASQTLIGYLYECYNPDPDAASFLVTSNLALPAELYRSLGGFDPGYPAAAAEDREFCDRARQREVQLVYAPEAVVYHSHRLDARGFWRQHFRYGRGAFQFHSQLASRSGRRIRIEGPAFYLGIAAYPFRQAEIRRPLAVAGLQIFSQIANALGFFCEWVQAGPNRKSRLGSGRR